MSNSLKIEKRILFDDCSQKSFITKQLKEQLNLKVLKTKQMFIKTFASSEPTLQNLEVVEVKIADVENSSYKIINTLKLLTYKFENNISAIVNLSSTHVLRISVQESNINYDSFFQKFWQIESSETKAKSFSDYSKHVYFNGHKYETPLPWRKHCELIPDNYVF